MVDHDVDANNNGVAVAVIDRVVVVTIDRPPVNAMRTVMWQQLDQVLDLVETDRSVSVVVLRSGLPTMFCACADVKELPMSAGADEARQRLTRRVLGRMVQFPVPIVCAVPGPALGGGCALAAACDIRLATRNATFGLPEINVGRCGGARHQMRHLPQGVVRRASFTGRPITADDAWRLGFVDELHHTAAQLDAATRALADEIASKSPTAIRMAEQSLDLAEELPLLRGYEAEQQFTLRIGGTPDAAEAAAAFKEKRRPIWTQG